MIDYVIIAVIGVAVFFAVRARIKARKNGNICSCCANSGSCNKDNCTCNK